MRLASIDLGEAAGVGDQAAILSAARALNTTCVKCHEAFPSGTGRSQLGGWEEIRNPL
jgi:hypothetical protein